jgi:hypothetical protein
MRLVPVVGLGEQPEVIKATVRLRTIPCVGRSNRRKTCLTLSPMQHSSFFTLARLLPKLVHEQSEQSGSVALLEVGKLGFRETRDDSYPLIRLFHRRTGKVDPHYQNG